METTGGIGGGERQTQDQVRVAEGDGISALSSAILVFVLSLAMHLPFLGLTPMAGTEAHRILPAHEMVRSGWWTVPTLFGKPFMTKPPLHLWLIAIAETLAGRGNVFVWRLPSAITGAALCAAVCLFGARWFGRVAGLISGVCCAGMITLWGQSQVADIDSSNTLAAAVCALCGIELLVARPRNAWCWIISAGLALAATLMTKGPGGLPIIVGVWIWGAVVTFRGRSPAPLLRDLVVPLLIGGAIFGAYVLFARHSLKLHHLQPDLSGVQEGASRLYATSWKTLTKALLTIPTQLFAFAIPVSLSLPAYVLSQIRQAIDPKPRQITMALVAAVLMAFFICVISGMDNPRYGYPALLALCPLAGAVAVAGTCAPETARLLRMIAAGSAIAYVAVAAALGVSAWRLSHSNMLLPFLIGSTIIALMVAAWMVGHLPRSWSAAWGFVPLILLVAIPFGFQRYADRSITSGFRSAADLRRMVGPATVIAAGNAAISKPELFYYSNIGVDYYTNRDQFMPANVARGTWVILDTNERKRWLREPGVHLEREQWLYRNGPSDYYVAWFP